MPVTQHALTPAISNASYLNRKLLPDFLYDNRKKIALQLPFCERNEKLNKKFIAKLNSWSDNTYSAHTYAKLGKLQDI